MTTATTAIAAAEPPALKRGEDAIAPGLRCDFAACARIARARARNFYYGLRLTPEPKRSAIYSVYAWMRAADDEADSPGTLGDKQDRLERFAGAAERLIGAEPLGAFEDSPVWRAFRATFHDYRLDPRDLRDMLRGLGDDLVAEHDAATRAGGPACAYATREGLLKYCYRVASTVGLICITIWGLRDETSREAARRMAIRRGHAFQLTNILRDFTQDLAEGRIYLPAEDFTRAGVSPSELRDWAKPRACERLVRDLAAWARGEYRASAGLEELIDPSCVATLWTMTEIYSGLLDLIERDPARLAGERRIRLPSWRKASLALRGLLMARRRGA